MKEFNKREKIHIVNFVVYLNSQTSQSVISFKIKLPFLFKCYYQYNLLKVCSLSSLWLLSSVH